MAPRTDDDADHRPDYPPQTPPPPKKPPNPPTPEPEGVADGTPAVTARGGVAMKNRRGVNWPMEAYPWAVATARRRVAAQLRAWGHRPDEAQVAAVVTQLFAMALADGGRRISIHLSDQGHQACILALSHQYNPVAGQEAAGGGVLDALAGIAIVAGCGTDTAPDGRRLWAVIDL